MRAAAERDALPFEGVVTDVRGGFYTVNVSEGAFMGSILCKLCGKMAMNRIRVITGDSVHIEVSPYDLSRGRISRRELARR